MEDHAQDTLYTTADTKHTHTHTHTQSNYVADFFIGKSP
jgi:hypothetical protein